MLKMSFFRQSDVKALKTAQDLVSNTPLMCSKCKDQTMEMGFIPTRHVRWEPLRWFKSKVEGNFGINLLNKSYLCVISYRCPKCGYLENYAPEIKER